MPRNNILYNKVSDFTDRIVRMVKYLKTKHANINYINQIDRCGTSIGANIAEGIYGQSRADFVSKLSIALKEADETQFWLDKLKTAEDITEVEHKSMTNDLQDIIHIIIATIKTTKKNGI